MSLLKIIQETTQGSDGKFSFQRWTILAFTIMFAVTWFCQLFLGYTLDQTTLIVISIVILVGWGILKAEHIVAILKRPSTYYGEDIYSFGRKGTETENNIPPEE